VIIPVALLDVEDYPEDNAVIEPQVFEVTVLADVIEPFRGICEWPAGHFTEIPRLLPDGSVFRRCHHFDDVLLYGQCRTKRIRGVAEIYSVITDFSAQDLCPAPS
jgi:hypothetical protein